MVVRLTLLTLVLSFASIDIAAQSDSILETELRKMYTADDGDVRYFVKWFDLNGDGTPEAMVYVVGPQVCGTSGCDTHIFIKHGSGYKLVATIGLSHPLIVAASARSHGWRDLIVFVAGGGLLPGYYAELRFDGREYPDNPTVKPAQRIRGKPRGTVLIKDFKVYTEGKPLVVR